MSSKIILISLLMGIVINAGNQAESNDISKAEITISTEKGKFKIAIWLKKCFAQDSSISGMFNCNSKANEMLNKELNDAYKNIMKKLDVNQQGDLKVIVDSNRWKDKTDISLSECLSNTVVGNLPTEQHEIASATLAMTEPFSP